MPKMELRQESRLNGVKTNIVNLDDIAVKLRVPTEYLMKYICAELGTSRDKDTIIKGKHFYDMILKTLDQFIIKYVLCHKCKLPETTFKVESKLLKSICRSCGKTNKLDNSHKVVTYMVKNLPTDI
jgi:translation initiation factor 2 beta subunit (eIF-2beta)/eIF-5